MATPSAFHVPDSYDYFTAVDLSLALVIVFLLGALSGAPGPSSPDF